MQERRREAKKRNVPSFRGSLLCLERAPAESFSVFDGISQVDLRSWLPYRADADRLELFLCGTGWKRGRHASQAPKREVRNGGRNPKNGGHLTPVAKGSMPQFYFLPLKTSERETPRA